MPELYRSPFDQIRSLPNCKSFDKLLKNDVNIMIRGIGSAMEVQSGLKAGLAVRTNEARRIVPNKKELLPNRRIKLRCRHK